MYNFIIAALYTIVFGLLVFAFTRRAQLKFKYIKIGATKRGKVLNMADYRRRKNGI